MNQDKDKARNSRISQVYDDAVKEVCGATGSSDSDDIYYGFGILTGVRKSQIQELGEKFQYQQHSHKFQEVSESKTADQPDPRPTNTIPANTNAPPTDDTVRRNEDQGNPTHSGRSLSINFLLD